MNESNVVKIGRVFRDDFRLFHKTYMRKTIKMITTENKDIQETDHGVDKLKQPF